MALLIGAATLSSCSDWFDISPKTDIKADDFFSQESGFTSALAGIYITMTTDAVYGDNLSVGLMDQLAQLYDRIPDGASGNMEQLYIYGLDTDGFGTKQRIADAWIGSYNLIANANNLLKWLDLKGEEVLHNPEMRAMYRGEALAIRAYVHLDLLRLWGPIYKENPEAKSIPYRTVADKSKLPLLKASEVIDKIIADLKEAKELLAFEKEHSLSDYSYQERRYRFNYHAVNATLARAYCYKGDAANAINSAQEVIDQCGLQLQDRIATSGPVMFDETLMGINVYKMDESFAHKFTIADKMGTLYWVSTRKLSDIFSEGIDHDLRSQSSCFYNDNSTGEGISRKYIKNDMQVVPLIRLPEMYYILCEMNNSLSDAAEPLNHIRHYRSYTDDTDKKFGDESVRIRELLTEYAKEYYAEGQTWHFMKRHNVSTLPYSPITFDAEKYIFPLPDAEKEYGWTAENENEETGEEQ